MPRANCFARTQSAAISTYSRVERVLAMALVVLGVTVLAAADGNGTAYPGALLSIDERVECERAIEGVYWQHRIWPSENPHPKPPLDALLPGGAIRERVTSYLQKSAALEIIWSRPLTGELLQAEMDRMVRDTKNGSLLRELFAVLDDDPFLIAECLARPTLVDRLARNWYARDARFHGALRVQAESVLADPTNERTPMPDLGGTYSVTEWRLAVSDSKSSNLDNHRAEHPVIDLAADEWHERIGHLAAVLRGEHVSEEIETTSALLERIPVNRRSGLVEKNDRFEVTEVLSKTPNRLKVATVTWSKKAFPEWWAEDGRSIVESNGRTDIVSPPPGGYELRSPRDSGCDPDTWASLGYQPSGRFGHTAVWTGTEMIVWGGGSSSLKVNTGGRYNPATDSWTATSTGAGVPAARERHTAVWTGTEMIIWGGYSGNPSPVYLNTGGRYDPAADSWTVTSTGTGLPTGRSNHSAIWTGTEMVVWGGRRWEGSSVYLSTGGRYDPATDTWVATSADVPTERTNHTSVWTGTEMIVWGGYNQDGTLNSGERYSPATDSWTETSTGPGVPAARYAHTAVWTGTEMIVWGGQTGSLEVNTGGRYNPATDSWSATSTGAGVPAAREQHTAVWTGSEMIVWGGKYQYYEDAFSLNTGGRYLPATNSWTATSTGAGVPAARERHTAVWTGSEMIVWGGRGATGFPIWSTGGRYDPTTDTWVATSADVPTERTNHTSVWTRTEMIVWGGYNNHDGTLNSGERYSPATDSWTETSTGAGVPAARDAHTAVWTGTEMIVWGGASPDYYTGGRYNPVHDTWMPTSTGSGVSQARWGHTAVWTGREMIVWGGHTNTSPYVLNSGGRYDPNTDSWTPTSTGSGVPAAREDHTAVWTGRRMIVWGGWASSNPLNTGGQYDPATDSWTATLAGGNAPTARREHSAVWTGVVMVVWGGYDYGYENTGGRYYPDADFWLPTSTGTGVPTERDDHTAVWTGTEMIVWGGKYGYDVYLNTGGRYDPAVNIWTATSTGTGVPTERSDHTAVWTGTEMIVWAGTVPQLNNGGLYCACAGETVDYWYPDEDGDGFGNGSVSVPSCVQLPGYITDGSDCDDGNPDTYPDAPEVNDGFDNQCPGEVGHGLVDEITGVCGFHNPVDANEFSCPLQAGATRYEVARSPHPEFPSWVGCLRIVSSAATWVDSDPVPEGTCFYYLVRTYEPNRGSWGADSEGIERTVICHR